MKSFRNKIVGVIFSLILVLMSFSSAYADTSDVDLQASSYENSSETNDIGIENMKVELGVGKISDSDVSDSSESYSSIDRLDVNYTKTSAQLTSLYGADRIKTAVKVSQNGWSAADTVVIVNSKNTMMGIVATPLATSLNAPILITGASSLDSSVATELSRLKPSNVIIIGDRNLISKAVSDRVKSITGANIERIFGSNSKDVSLAVAKRISSIKSVDTAYVVSETNGVADALTISSKAGSTKNPVIVVDKNTVSTNTFAYLRDNISTVFYIGGVNSISNTLLNKINTVVDNAGSINRIYGSDRHDTNVNVINRFYKDKNIPVLVVTKSDNQGLIDTVCAGPFAALYNAPILITNKTYVPAVTKSFLSKVTVATVYQIGGSISSSVSNTIKNPGSNSSSQSDANSGSNSSTDRTTPNVPKPQVDDVISGSIKGKTIVIDPGHGGKDSGASGLYNTYEKNWTLTTALACADYLTKAGANVVMTRKTDIYPTLQDRADISNNSGAVLFCSIHYNKGGSVVNEATGELSGNGVEVFKGDGESANAVAQNILNSILSGFNLRNRGVKDGTHLYVIANTVAPAVLVEGGFMSSSRDVSMLNSQAALKKMGVQIAKGIIASFK